MSAIEGKVVAITGASSGIGEAAARLLAECGGKVVVGRAAASGSKSSWQTFREREVRLVSGLLM
jgi:NAD(P)-dependent dehydrogenase (short-subunit alcohol dehydrogenase family)